MTALSLAERELMRRCPLREAIPKTTTGASRGMMDRLRMVADLRERKLITVAIDGDASDAKQIMRVLSLTGAGVAALHAR